MRFLWYVCLLTNYLVTVSDVKQEVLWICLFKTTFKDAVEKQHEKILVNYSLLNIIE